MGSSKNNISITPEIRERLAAMVDAVGGGRRFERAFGIATGKISRIIHGRIRSVSPEVWEKLNGGPHGRRPYTAPAALERDLSDGSDGSDRGTLARLTVPQGAESGELAPRAERLAADLGAIAGARNTKLAELFGRAQAALEIARDTTDDVAMDKAMEIVRHTLGEFYGAAVMGKMDGMDVMDKDGQMGAGATDGGPGRGERVR